MDNFECCNDDGFDWGLLDDVAKFTNEVAGFRAFVFCNEYLDVKELDMHDEGNANDCVNLFFRNPSQVTQLIIPNPYFDVHGGDVVCSHFRLITEDYHSKSPTNYKLETFLHQAGIRGIHSRCTKAMVFGLDGNMNSIVVSIPTRFWAATLPVMSLLQPLKTSEEKCSEICGIQGMLIPFSLPPELDWNILKYCQHPCATAIQEEMDRINDYWDYHFDWMFLNINVS